MAAVVIVVATVFFFNGYMVASVEEKRKEKSFFIQWNEEVEENQDTLVGRVLMKGFYFIPTGIEVASKCIYALKKSRN